MPQEIEAVLKEFEDIFPKDLPPGLPPIHNGYEFKIDLEDYTPLVYWPIYKLSLLELEEARKQIEHMLEHEFIRPAESPYGALVLFAPKKVVVYAFALTTGGSTRKMSRTDTYCLFQRKCSTGWEAPQCSARLT